MEKILHWITSEYIILQGSQKQHRNYVQLLHKLQQWYKYLHGIAKDQKIINKGYRHFKDKWKPDYRSN